QRSGLRLQSSQKIRRQRMRDEFVFNWRHVARVSQSGVDQHLIVSAARQAELVFETRRVQGDDPRGTRYLFECLPQILTSHRPGNRSFQRGSLARSLSSSVLVEIRNIDIQTGQ